MLRRVRGLAHVATRWLMATALATTSACGDDGDAPAPAEAPAEAAPSGPAPSGQDWSERLGEPTVADLLAALDQPHQVVREALGPHRLQVVTDTSLVPPSSDGEEGHPALDSAVVAEQSVHDELTLQWQPPDDAGDRLSLSQHNDHERGRDVVVIGETIHVRKAHRGWVHYPRDSDLLERWLDDAQRSVHDAIELAAPGLSLQATTREGAGLRGSTGVEITLDLAETIDDDVVTLGPTQAWRRDVTLEAVEGTVVLDAQTGAWISAEVDVRYRLPGADGRPLSGHLHLRGTLEPDPKGTVSAPADSQPLPSRVRYDQEQRELLDGLAAP